MTATVHVAVTQTTTACPTEAGPTPVPVAAAGEETSARYNSNFPAALWSASACTDVTFCCGDKVREFALLLLELLQSARLTSRLQPDDHALIGTAGVSSQPHSVVHLRQRARDTSEEHYRSWWSTEAAMKTSRTSWCNTNSGSNVRIDRKWLRSNRITISNFIILYCQASGLCRSPWLLCRGIWRISGERTKTGPTWSSSFLSRRPPTQTPPGTSAAPPPTAGDRAANI